MKKILLLLISFFLIGCSTLENDIISSADEVSNAVVRIECVSNDVDKKGNIIQKLSIGSGVIYKTYGKNKFGVRELDKNRKYDEYEYYLLTNRHVIDGNESIKIYLGETDVYLEGKLLGYDEKLDIAILSFVYDKYIQKVEFAATGVLKKGSFVFTIGNPDGFLDSLSMGVVSYPVRNISHDSDEDTVKDYVSRYIQIDAAINPGSSGGGLFNSKGQLIGINTMKIVDETIEGIGFAILIDDIKPIISYLENGLSPNRLELGITVNDINKPNLINIPDSINYGLIVINIKNGSVAEAMGLEVNDIIIEVNGKKIKSIEDLILQANTIIINEDNKIVIKVLRNEKKMTFKMIV